jgi:hypothetical protein
MNNDKITKITIPLKSINTVSTYSCSDNIIQNNEKIKYGNLAKLIIEQFPSMELYNPIGIRRNSSDRKIKIDGIEKTITIIEISNKSGFNLTAPPGSGTAVGGIFETASRMAGFGGGKYKTRKNKKSKKSTKKNKQKRNKKNKKRKTSKSCKTLKR